jgi:hypothetical protein
MLKKRTRPTVKNNGYVTSATSPARLHQPRPGDPDYLTIDEAERRAMVCKAREAELRIQQIEGTLVERSAVEKAVFESTRRVRDGVQNVAARISGLVAVESDQARCFAILQQELTQVLQELAGAT